MNFLADLFSNIKFYVVIIIVGTIVTFTSIYILKYYESNIDDDIYEVTADEILEEYIKNNIQAELKYKEHIIKIRGNIESITGNEDRVEVVLYDSFLWYKVTLVFTDTNEINQIDSLHANDFINVIGTVGEFNDGFISNILTIHSCNYDE